MTLPFTHMSSFVLSFFALLFVAVGVYKVIDVSISTLKKINDA